MNPSFLLELGMHGPFRNSDFKVNTYFKRFSAELEEAKKRGRDVWVNEVRKYNNCYYARKLQGDVSIREIVRAVWPSFKEKYASRLTRPGLVEAVESFIGCHDFANGYLYYECPSCGDFYMIGFSCHSRICPSCGKKYRDARSAKVSAKCLEVPHRQFVFTIPHQLRRFFRAHRKPMLNALFASVNDAFALLLKRHAPKAYAREGRKHGIICFLHTFGRDMKWHPHIHVLVAERWMDRDGNLHKHDYFSFDFLRLAFMNALLSRAYAFCKESLGKDEQRAMWLLQKELRGRYPKGYYVYGRKFGNGRTTTKDMRELTHYIARYASHPAISERRIASFDQKAMKVTWFFDPHEDDGVEEESLRKGRQYVTESAESFIMRLLIHVPDKGFQQIRYYGFYANKCKAEPRTGLLFSYAELRRMAEDNTWAKGLMKAFGYDPTVCKCGARMAINYELSDLKGEYG